MKKNKAQKPQMKDKSKFKKTKKEAEVSDKNSTDKDTMDKKSVHHGSKIPKTMKKGKEEKVSSAFKNGKVSGAKVKDKDPAFSKKTTFEERKELLRKKYRG